MKEVNHHNGPEEKMLKQPDPCQPVELVPEDRLANITKELSQFTYIVSHDLQAPLRMITGFLELLQKKYEEKLDEQGKLYIHYAVKGAEKMKRLIFDLLDYSRLNTADEAFDLLKLNEVTTEIIQKYSTRINDTRAAITVSKLPEVKARRKQMTQLLGHLVDNALKFRAVAEPDIRITAVREGEFWKIMVGDNGIGIDPAYADKIFTVFRKLHPDEENDKGTGIGLALCKKITELHGGRMGVESAAGKGSKFWFTLPVS